MKPCLYLLSRNKHFFTKSCQSYEQPPQTSQNSDFQSHFSVSKIGQIFPKKIPLKNIGLGDLVLLNNVFEILYFLKMCPIFVGSVHNFGKSGDDII